MKRYVNIFGFDPVDDRVKTLKKHTQLHHLQNLLHKKERTTQLLLTKPSLNEFNLERPPTMASLTPSKPREPVLKVHIPNGTSKRKRYRDRFFLLYSSI